MTELSLVLIVQDGRRNYWVVLGDGGYILEDVVASRVAMSHPEPTGEAKRSERCFGACQLTNLELGPRLNFSLLQVCPQIFISHSQSDL